MGKVIIRLRHFAESEIVFDFFFPPEQGWNFLGAGKLGSLLESLQNNSIEECARFRLGKLSRETFRHLLTLISLIALPSL